MKIKKIKVKAFRGITQEKEIEFAPVTILFGLNAQGKSSILNAIEWCFFGENCVGRNTGIRERIDWEIKNRNVNFNPLVTIQLDNGEELSRELISSRRDNFKGNNPLLNKYSFKDFLTGVYQHQETIRAILVEEPRLRNEAFDRLLGLSDYRNILESLKKAKDELKKDSDKLDNEISKFYNQIKANANSWKTLKENEEKELKSQNIEISEENIKNYKIEIINELTKFMSSISIQPSEEFKNLNVKTQDDDFCRIINSEIKRLISEMPDVKEQKKLFDRLSKLNQLLTEYKNYETSFKQKENELKNFINTNNTKNFIENKKCEIEEEIKKLENEKAEKNLQGVVIEKAIQYMEREKIEDICPVCGTQRQDLLQHLKEEWRKKIETALKILNEKMKKLNEDLIKIDNLLKEYNKIEKDLEFSRNKLKEKVNEIKKESGIEIREDEDAGVILNKEITAIENELSSLKKRVEEKSKTLNVFENKVNLIIKISKILKLEEMMEKANKLEMLQEWQEIRNKQIEMENLIEKLEKIIKAVQKALQDEAKKLIESAGSKISQYFKRITQNPAIDEIIFDFKPDKSTGLNTYEIKTSDNRPVAPILSQGNFNALALSIFLALCENMPFEFIILDDPSQSLSSKEKENFVDILNEISQKKDIIIATMDDQLYELLKEKITKIKKIYEFKDWNPLDGPSISEVF